MTQKKTHTHTHTTFAFSFTKFEYIIYYFSCKRNHMASSTIDGYKISTNKNYDNNLVSSSF